MPNWRGFHGILQCVRWKNEMSIFFKSVSFYFNFGAAGDAKQQVYFNYRLKIGNIILSMLTGH